MTQTILITGGAGFIGSALTAAAIAQGHKVIVLDKLTYAGHQQNLDWIKGDWKLIQADVADAPVVKKIFDQYAFDAVVHAAAESHVDNSIKGSTPFMVTNILGTQVMLEAALNQWNACGKPENFRYLQVSTDEVYGALGKEGVFTTATPLAPNSPYAASKASADLLVRAWHKTYGLPTLITRCCNNYGPRQHPEKLIPLMITRAVSGGQLPVYGDGQQVREWIHVDDHARGVLATLAKGKPGGVYHLGSGEEHPNLEIVHTICDTLGGNARAQITHVADRLGHDFRYALDVEESKKSLGFATTIGFRDGLGSTVQWYLDHPQWIHTMQQWKGA